MSKVTLKVQRPIFQTESTECWLIYDEKRTFLFEIPPDEDLLELMGVDSKMYVKAEIIMKDGDANIIFQERIPQQAW